MNDNLEDRKLKKKGDKDSKKFTFEKEGLYILISIVILFGVYLLVTLFLFALEGS